MAHRSGGSSEEIFKEDVGFFFRFYELGFLVNGPFEEPGYFSSKTYVGRNLESVTLCICLTDSNAVLLDFSETFFLQQCVVDRFLLHRQSRSTYGG